MKQKQLTKTEKFLQLFTEVRPGEGKTALLMFTNVFLILLAYYCIKPIREGCIAVSDIDGKYYSLTILSNTGQDEDIAVLGGA